MKQNEAHAVSTHKHPPISWPSGQSSHSPEPSRDEKLPTSQGVHCTEDIAAWAEPIGQRPQRQVVQNVVRAVFLLQMFIAYDVT